MKYCPYCGAPMQTSDAKFCSECGREFAPVEHEQAKQKKKRRIPLFFVKKGTKAEAAPQHSETTESAAEASDAPGENADQDYDGYYDDIVPGDAARKREFVDRVLLLKILAVFATVIVITSVCIVVLYLL